ncbi:MAG: hypothetical protein ACRETL_04130, partial [Gammaproteobacteria bacterium]
MAGSRIAQKAADNKWYSRSLQTNTQHWIGVTCGADAEASNVQATTNKPLGNTWAEPYPYDPASPLGYAWPTIDFVDKTKSYVDPETGVLLKRLTGLDEPNTADAPATPTRTSTASFSVNGAWSVPQNGAAVDGQVATSTDTTPLFAAFSPIHTAYSASRPLSWDVNNVIDSVTDVQAQITGSGTGGQGNAQICLTVNGVSCATERETITLPPSLGAVTYPSGTMTNYFADWIGNTITTPPATYDMATFTGTVNVSGATVTLASGNQFDVGAWTNGSHIFIAGATGCTAGDYTILSVDSDTALTLYSSPGACTGAPYTGYNFGLLIYPAGAAVLS